MAVTVRGPAVRALFSRLVDHAPTFPPASLAPVAALEEDRRAQASAESFVLARLVWPASRWDELDGAERALSAVLDALPPHDRRVESVELRNPGKLTGLGALAAEVYVELPVADVHELPSLAELGLRAKVRCGGAHVPTVEELAAFVRVCRSSGVLFKATAGLHHAVRTDGEHGFLNLLAAAVLGDEAEALAETDPSAFRIGDGSFEWRGRCADAAAVARVRRDLFVSFGSCSFFEPVEELVALGILLIQYGVYTHAGSSRRVGVRAGDAVVPLLDEPSLGPLLARGSEAWAETLALAREAIGTQAGVPLAEVELHLPFEVADYVDFYSSRHHAENLGRLFRPGSEPLLPNWRWLPIGYHGRAGTIVVSGSDVVRPSGQRKRPDEETPTFGPSRRLDIELELGFVVGTPSRLGEPVPVERAREHVFGAVLVNDWSARDIQAWEYQPLGPFLGKSFTTSISGWVTPLAELDGRRVVGEAQEPPPLPHLRAEPWAYDLPLEVELNGTVISRTSARHLYWSLDQQVAHLTSNGAALRSGDLLASGTISGPGEDERGSLIELTWNGDRPLRFDDGSERTFLEDGDEVVLRGEGLGDVRGLIVGSPE